MNKYENVAQDSEGNVIANATVTVKEYPGGTNATIYSANSTSGGNVNGFLTGEDGSFEFFAANGRYNVEISKPGRTTKINYNILIQDLSSSDGSSLVGFLQSGTGAVSRTVQAKERDIVSVFDFMSAAQVSDVQARTLTLDVSAAINLALAAAKSVYLPDGSYLLTAATVALTLQGQKLIGSGRTACILSQSTAATKAISIATGLQNVEIAGFTLTRTATATAGGDGIGCETVSIGQAKIRDILVEKQYNGLSLGPTDFSDIQNVIVQKCTNDGVYLTNTAGDGAVQWSMRDVLSQMNAGRGFAIVTIAGPAQVTLGTYSDCATFANTGRGMAFIGSVGVPINDIRLRGGFIGEDGDSEVYLDTYGKNHQLNDLFVELAGQRTTGPTLATAASATGSGIQTTANNTNVQISNCLSSANSLDGMHLSGVSHAISNPVCTNNGQAASAGRRNGIFLAAGRCTIVGGICSNTGAGTSQTYGVLNHDANNIAIIGTDLNNNSTAGYGSNGAGPYITAMGNLPNTLNVGLSPQGAVLVGGAATGDWNAAGTINVAGGLLKNDTAYTNP